MIIANSYPTRTRGIIVKFKSYKYDRMLETSFTGWRLRYERRNSILKTCQYPDLVVVVVLQIGHAAWKLAPIKQLLRKLLKLLDWGYWINLSFEHFDTFWIHFYGFLVSPHNEFFVYLLTRFSGRLEIYFSRPLQIKEPFSRLISCMADETNEVAR